MADKAIIFIHGRGPQDKPAVLKPRWIDALKTTFVHPLNPDTDVRFAHYADIFYAGGPGVVFSGTSTGLPPTDAETLAYLIERLQSDDELKPDSPDAAGEATFGLPPESEDFAVDVLRYYGDDEYYKKVNGTLEKALRACRGKEIALVSHSMGTLISYEVLRTGTFALDTWVTMGSPLGWAVDIERKLPGWLKDATEAGLKLNAKFKRSIKRIKDHTTSLLGRVFSSDASFRAYRSGLKQYPEGVDRWFNLYDPLDKVANPTAIGDPNCADDFPMPNGAQRVFDVPLANTERPGYHNATGYLATMQLGQLMSDFWRR